VGVAQIVERQIRHFDLRREIAPCLAGSLLRGQGAVKARKQQGVVRELSGAKLEPNFQLRFSELAQRLDQKIGQADVAAIVSESSVWAGCTVSDCDVEGKEILHNAFSEDGETSWRVHRRILNSKSMRAAIDRGNLICDRRTTFGKKVVRLIETAEKYETERAAAIERSSLDDAIDRQFMAANEIEKLAFEAFEIESRTMAGALIQARALNACAETEFLIYYRSRSAQLFGNALAQSLTRLS
jgi:hypothetical protein